MSKQQLKLSHVLDDLCSRFIINLPEEELHSFERICFQIEAAHWFYEDFYREHDPKLPPASLKLFARQMFEHCALLRPYLAEHSIDEIFASFTHYKTRVPVCGAILLNTALDKCLLVKGWHSRSSWGFPKGKINKDEPELECAKREVYEETGFQIPDGLITEEDYIEFTKNEQRVRLYIVPYVSENTPFAPRTRKEISKIKWHLIKELPSYNSKQTPGVRKTENFFMVSPVVGRLKKWIQVRRQRDKRIPGAALAAAAAATSTSSSVHPPPGLTAASSDVAPRRMLLRNTPPGVAGPAQPGQGGEAKARESRAGAILNDRRRGSGGAAATGGGEGAAYDDDRRHEEEEEEEDAYHHGGAQGRKKAPNPLLTFQFDVAAILRHLPPAL